MFMRILYAILTAWSIMFYTYVCEAEEFVIYSFALPIVGTEHTSQFVPISEGGRIG